MAEQHRVVEAVAVSADKVVGSVKESTEKVVKALDDSAEKAATLVLQEQAPPSHAVVEKERVARTLAAGKEQTEREKAVETEKVAFGQRRINMIWELTQALVAVSVTLTTLAAACVLMIKVPGDTRALQLLSNGFFLIVGFYFSRTNHTKQGGVPPAGTPREMER